MSATNTQGQSQLPEADAAYNTLFHQINAPVFFGKLANDYGVVANTPEDAGELLKLAATLRTVAPPVTKQASAYSLANQHLNQTLETHGLNGRAKQASIQEHAMARKQAAARAVKDPTIYASILALKQAEAAQLATA